MIIAALIVGAALLMRIPSTFTLLGYPGLAMIFFCIAAVIGLCLVIRMMMKDEDFTLKK